MYLNKFITMIKTRNFIYQNASGSITFSMSSGTEVFENAIHYTPELLILIHGTNLILLTGEDLVDKLWKISGIKNTS